MTVTTFASAVRSRNGPSVIERAFELARSGTCSSVQEVAQRLKREGFESVEAHLAGMSIRRQLKELCSTNTAIAAPAE